LLQGKAEGPRLETRDAGARRAGPVSAREFEFLRYAIDVSQNLPRACLTFSTSLDPARDYRPYVAVSPATQIALSVEGANLCVGGLTFGQEREITIRSGMPSADNRTLAFDETVPV